MIPIFFFFGFDPEMIPLILIEINSVNVSHNKSIQSCLQKTASIRASLSGQLICLSSFLAARSNLPHAPA